jgi:hypothetical protein
LAGVLSEMVLVPFLVLAKATNSSQASFAEQQVPSPRICRRNGVVG